MGAFRPELILVPVVGCPLASRLLSGDRRFDDVYGEPAPLQPPGWVFGPVWTALYVLLGWALARAAEAGPETDPGALRDMVILLVLNVAWTPLFLRGHVRTALVLILFMVGQAAWVASASGALRPFVLPYVAWISFAAWLNAYYARRQGTLAR